MLVYALLSVLIFVIWLRVTHLPESVTRNKREADYTNLLIIIIVILAAFRSEGVGADTPGYMREYGEMTRLSWGQIAERFNGYSMYYYISKVFSVLHIPLFVWFGFVELIYLYSIKLIMDRYTKDKILGIMVFVTMGLFTFSLAGLKQVMAMSFTLFAFNDYIDKRYIKTLVLMVLAFLCHSTALFFLPVFALYTIKERRMFWPLVIVSIIILVFWGSEFLIGAVGVYESETGNAHFSTYLDFENTHSPVMLIFYISMILFCIPGIASFKKKDSGLMRLSLGLCMIAAASQVLAFLSPHAFRFAYYYLPFYLVLIPNSYTYMSNDIKKIVGFVIVFSLVFYFLYVNRENVYTMAFIM